MILRICGAVLAGMSLAVAIAAPAAGETAAHRHGVGQLNVSVEAGAAQLELEAPGADIVGFEHPPATAGDRAAIAAARQVLEAGDALFVFPSNAGCALASADIHGPGAEDHDDDHKAGHKDDHDEAEHSTFRAVYSFICSGAAAPESMTVRYFERFPRSERLHVQVIGPDGQSARTLTPDAVELTF